MAGVGASYSWFFLGFRNVSMIHDPRIGILTAIFSNQSSIFVKVFWGFSLAFQPIIVKFTTSILNVNIGGGSYRMWRISTKKAWMKIFKNYLKSLNVNRMVAVRIGICREASFVEIYWSSWVTFKGHLGGWLDVAANKLSCIYVPFKQAWCWCRWWW